MADSHIGRPEPTEYAEYYGRYVGLVPEDNLCAAMAKQTEQKAVKNEYLQRNPERDQ